MSPKSPARETQSAINSVALQNLRIIRRRLNDKAWIRAAERKLAKNQSVRGKSKDLTKERSEYEIVLKFAIFKLVDEYAEKGKIPKGWDPNEGLPLPEFPKSRKQFAAATGIDEGHLRALEDGIVDFTLDDAIQIARIGNMDLATFLTPAFEELEKELYFPLSPVNPKLGNPLMSEWLLWIHGFRPLPGQDREDFIKQTASPAPLMKSLDDTRSYRGHDMVAKDEKLMQSSKVYVYGFAKDLSNPNPFRALLSPFEKAPKHAKSITEANQLIIRNVLLLATQLKNIMSSKEKGGLTEKRKRFVALLDFIRYCISAIVRILMKLGK